MSIRILEVDGLGRAMIHGAAERDAERSQVDLRLLEATGVRPPRDPVPAERRPRIRRGLRARRSLEERELRAPGTDHDRLRIPSGGHLESENTPVPDDRPGDG